MRGPSHAPFRRKSQSREAKGKGLHTHRWQRPSDASENQWLKAMEFQLHPTRDEKADKYGIGHLS